MGENIVLLFRGEHATMSIAVLPQLITQFTMDTPNDGHFDVFGSIAIKRILPNNAIVSILGSVIDKPRFNSA